MKRKDIEKAAEKYAEENSWYPGETSYESDIIAIEESFADAFKAGVKWRINSVWHDSTEKPMPGQFLLVRTLYGGYDLCYYGEYVWNTVMTWAYVKDLIPNTED